MVYAKRENPPLQKTKFQPNLASQHHKYVFGSKENF